jgi:phosphomannomutase
LEANGASVNASLILALLAQRALETSSSGATILYAANVSRIVPETVRERGGEPIMTKVGHAHISRAMREHRALLGGELSGHFFFREFFCRDDAIVAMLRIVSMLSAAPSFESLLEPLRRYVQSGEMNFSVRNKEEAMRRVSEVFSDGTHSHLDGLTVEYPDWWFNLRPSHTEDLLRLNVEAKNEALLAEKLEMLKALLT